MLARSACRKLLSSASRRQMMMTASSSRAASSLVVAPHADGKLSSDTFGTVAAATQIGGPVTVLVAGAGTEVAQEAANIAGVDAVLHTDDEAYAHGTAENVTGLVVAAQKSANFTHILAPSNNYAKAILPRVGALLDVQPISDILSVEDESTFTRPMYAGNAIATVKSNDDVKVMTVRTTAFEKAAAEGGSASVDAAPDNTDGAADAGLTTWKADELSQSDRPELGSARVVISGGRGLKNGENFALLEALADKLDGAVGASRAAVDAGMVPNDMQVGQTGKVVAPDLYVAVGLSGAIQHLAGMKDSKTIVCINTDAEAPIFQVSDYGLVADLFKAVPEMTEKV